jgi:hypothetical protein
MANFDDRPEDTITRRRTEDEPVTLTATEARQGNWGRPVLYVLVCGLILAMVAWWGAEYYGSAIAPPGTDQTITSSVRKAPLAGEKVIDDNQPKGEPVQKSPTIQDSNKL